MAKKPKAVTSDGKVTEKDARSCPTPGCKENSRPVMMAGYGIKGMRLRCNAGHVHPLH